MSETSNQRLRQLRRQLNLTQKEFADIISIKQGSLSDIERGRIGISEKIIDLVVEKFNINRTWLLAGSGKTSNDKNFKIQGINTGDYTGKGRKEWLKNALNDLERAKKSNSGYWILFNDELKQERPELAELITLFAQIGRFANELPELDKAYFKPILDKLDLLTDNSYNSYKSKAISILEDSMKLASSIKPAVEALKKLIDSGNFPIPKK
ncbi:MAG: helix-turn-helix transcriptional regulator [Cyclobacteriaceae bacterium]|nr:helix-turn-helix transcriptional regulator [Cyclobacteriaceae bacterium]